MASSISGPGRTGGYTVVNLGAEYRPIPSLQVFAQVNNVFDREYYTAAQLGSTGFDGARQLSSRGRSRAPSSMASGRCSVPRSSRRARRAPTGWACVIPSVSEKA